MNTKTDTAPNILRKILIVEDEKSLAERFRKDLFSGDGSTKEIELAHCVEQARGILASGASYDVMVLDVMLPITKSDLRDVIAAEKKLAELRKIIREEEYLRDGDVTTKTRIQNAYNDRPQVLERIQKHREREAALTMIDKAKEDGSFAKWPPVVVVTAFGDEDIGRKISKALANHPHRYLVKPVSSERLETSILELLEDQSR